MSLPLPSKRDAIDTHHRGLSAVIRGARLKYAAGNLKKLKIGVGITPFPPQDAWLCETPVFIAENRGFLMGCVALPHFLFRCLGAEIAGRHTGKFLKYNTEVANAGKVELLADLLYG